jgi:hypothetical protein
VAKNGFLNFKQASMQIRATESLIAGEFEVLISREDAIQKIIGRLSSLISSTEKGQKEKEDVEYSINVFKKGALRESKNKLLSYRYIMG